MYINEHSHAKHFCALKGIGDHTGPTGSMAWNSILKPRLQLQVPNQMEVKPLKTSPVRQHGSSSRNTGTYSYRGLQGRLLRDPRKVTEKSYRNSFKDRRALLMACGVQCVLSPRPSNCCPSSPHKEKDRPRSSPARAQSSCTDPGAELKLCSTCTVIKRSEQRERARSSVYSQRVQPDSSTRPSTVPLETGRGRQGTPETPMCTIIWKRKDDTNVFQDTPQHLTEDKRVILTPSLHLYLPSLYQPQHQGEDAALEESMSQVQEKQDNITIESQKDAINEGEGQNDLRDDLKDTCLSDKPTERSFENDTTEERPPQQKHTPEIPNCGTPNKSVNSTHGKQEYDITETEGVCKRTKSTGSTHSKVSSKTQFPNTAMALTFPSPTTVRNPTPAVSILPSFYGTSFGCRIRTVSEPRWPKTRTSKASDDNGITQPATDMLHTTGIKGNPCLLKPGTELPVDPHPKIMSIERGSQPRKMKTTKTFLWGPEGPHEMKTVYELHSHVNRWRSLD